MLNNSKSKIKSRLFGFCETSIGALSVLNSQQPPLTLDGKKLVFQLAQNSKTSDQIRALKSVEITNIPSDSKFRGNFLNELTRKGFNYEYFKIKRTKVHKISTFIRFTSIVEASRFVRFKYLYYFGVTYTLKVVESPPNDNSFYKNKGKSQRNFLRISSE